MLPPERRLGDGLELIELEKFFTIHAGLAVTAGERPKQTSFLEKLSWGRPQGENYPSKMIIPVECGAAEGRDPTALALDSASGV
jgi:hypothetical protein